MIICLMISQCAITVELPSSGAALDTQKQSQCSQKTDKIEIETNIVLFEADN